MGNEQNRFNSSEMGFGDRVDPEPDEVQVVMPDAPDPKIILSRAMLNPPETNASKATTEEGEQ